MEVQNLRRVWKIKFLLKMRDWGENDKECQEYFMDILNILRDIAILNQSWLDSCILIRNFRMIYLWVILNFLVDKYCIILIFRVCLIFTDKHGVFLDDQN